MRKKIGILYICTGKYTVFWDKFYSSSEMFLLPELEKHYFVFTDGEINTHENPFVKVVEQERLGWPFDTLYRFKMFLKIENQIQEMDYLYFFNSNLVIMQNIGNEILPDEENELVVTQHPGFFDKKRNEFTYETNKESTACIDKNEGNIYVAGGLNGGTTQNFLKFAKMLSQNIEIDYNKGIIAKWHDESHLNRYIIGKNVKVLSPSYLFPQDWNIPFEQKILILDKTKFGGHDFLRQIPQTLGKKKKMNLILIKAGYLIYGLFSFLCKKKIVFFINGGLGSQMWQYAVGQAIEKTSTLPVYYDLSFYSNDGKDCTGENNRKWELETVFPNVKVNKANASEIYFYKKFFNKKYTANGVVISFIEEILTSKQPRYLGEYYCNVKYFEFIEDYLKDKFIFNTSEFSENTVKMANIIKNTSCAVALQVRRGDFTALNWDKLSPPEYFFNALEKMKQLLKEYEITYFVFSTDIPFCKEMLSTRKENFVFVDINDNDNGAQDMYLISLCRHFILSAISNFGFWGAFLSSVDKTKIVIMPEKCNINETDDEKGGMLMNKWIGL